MFWVGPAGLPINLDELSKITPMSYLALSWGAQHRRLAGTAIADSADVGRWEAVCLLIAIKTWCSVIAASSGTLAAVGDALGMLHGAAKFKAKDPGIDLTFMEMALIFAPSGGTTETLHLWSKENALADSLS